MYGSMYTDTHKLTHILEIINLLKAFTIFNICTSMKEIVPNIVIKSCVGIPLGFSCS